jgi:SOS response regulatory protein OraA/RecX
VEKDWIDDARLLYNDLHDRPEKDFREAIEKHAPQVKKISKEDIKRYMSTLTLNEQTYLNGKFLREFLKDH